MTDAPDGSKIPISSAQRQVRTFWNIASEAGRTCGIVGWWATWPADPINGFLISDYVAWHSFGVTGRSTVDQGKTWPPDLIKLVDELMPSPLEIPDHELQKMVHLPGARLQPDPTAGPYDDPLAHLRQAMATSRGYTDLVLHQLDKTRPQLMSVYFEGTDAVTHLFGDFQAPRLPWVSDADFAAYRDVINEYWKWQDALVGELFARTGAAHDRPRDQRPRLSHRRGTTQRDTFDIETADADHILDGIVIINGPNIQPGARITNADIYDVTPTVLYALELAVGSDMKGRVLTDAFAGESLHGRPVKVVATYETSPLARSENNLDDPEASEELMKMLRSLGYVSGAAGGGGAETYTAEQVVNLATVLMRRNRSAEAVLPSFAKLWPPIRATRRFASTSRRRWRVPMIWQAVRRSTANW